MATFKITIVKLVKDSPEDRYPRSEDAYEQVFESDKDFTLEDIIKAVNNIE